MTTMKTGKRNRKPGAAQAQRAIRQAQALRNNRIREVCKSLKDFPLVEVPFQLDGYNLTLRYCEESFKHDSFYALVKTKSYGYQLGFVIMKYAGRIELVTGPKGRTIGYRDDAIMAMVVDSETSLPYT